MKSISNTLFAIVVLLVTSGVYAQPIKNKSPRWVSKKGFWQIESNIHTPGKNIVYFFNNDRVLVYKENLDGVVLNLKKKRVKMRLKKALEAAIFTWNKNGRSQNDQELVNSLFKR